MRRLFMKTILVAHILLFLNMCSICKSDESFEILEGFKNKMIFVEGGPVQMKNDYEETRTIHLKDFYLSQFEVTVGEYKKYCKDTGIDISYY